ncbi:polysaccharide pyruvyl transferase family protein [Metabacillus sp. KIGAM252]|uniref:Polysaccharide pyruvyl transferase family protein n=1 Tax=Metabacillus flavus TaxID=2823519 RepID=A0ABS5LAZ2_9BACI|nr:polysaccharide pyruvyl transferase family protein [Metabacillus flavus]MBS2967892.1 polysaccharide pyruvyl transferase family protein [Metabacillus flavus]
MKRILYIGWLGYKNLGDELMFDLFKEQFSSLGEGYKLDAVNNEPVYLDRYPLDSYDLIVLGGGSILSGPQHFIQPSLINTLHKAVRSDKKVMIWGSGIDWVPKPLHAALQEKREWKFTGHEDLYRKTKEVFEKAIWAGVRGPLTEGLLKNLGVSPEKIHVSGDPGFLLKKAEEDFTKPVQKIIGVNWGTTYNMLYGNDENKVEDQLAAALKGFIKKGYKVYLYTVWSVDLPAAERLYEKINEREDVVLDKHLYHQDELISLLEDFSFTINFKLHPNFLSLAAHVPFAALGYRFKVFDFVKSIDLEELVISTDSNDITAELAKAELYISQNRDRIVEKMKFWQAYYRYQMTKPFEQQLYL